MDETRREALLALLKQLGLGPVGDVLATLDAALTHRSFAAENPPAPDNERLEFLGDAVLGLACTEYLYTRYPEGNEGDLSRLKAVMVSRRILGSLARQMNLGENLRLGVGERRSGGRTRDSVVGSALEAVIGALSLHYPWETLRAPLLAMVIQPAERLAQTRESQKGNAKSRLQELVQRDFPGDLPAYEVQEQAGPDHSKVFIVSVSVDGQVLGVGKGGRIRWAENEAASAALEVLQKQQPNAGKR
jgi:ribonuclease-3